MKPALDLSQHASNWAGNHQGSLQQELSADLVIDTNSPGSCFAEIDQRCRMYGATAVSIAEGKDRLHVRVEAPTYYAIVEAQQRAMRFGAVKTIIGHTMMRPSVPEIMRWSHSPDQPLAEVIHPQQTQHVSDGEVDQLSV